MGQALTHTLLEEGYEVTPLVRSRGPAYARGCWWDPESRTIDAHGVSGHDAVVHLAGESIASGRWTRARKARIRKSRVESTALLCECLASRMNKPKVLVSASAVGFYGDTGDTWVDEDSAAGKGFLAEVCEGWEAATAPAREAGIRVVNLRIGVVLCGHGGALARMLPPFRMGLGGPVGRGRAFMSWITLRDLVSVVQCAIADERLQGPVNAVAPNPVSNREFAAALGRVLGKRAWMPLPSLAVRLAMGEMGVALLLRGQRVRPGRLQGIGYSFEHPELEPALHQIVEES